MRKSTIFSSGLLRRQIFKVLSLGIAGMLSFSMANAQMAAGTYFINGNSPTGGVTYNSFADFFTALSTAGNAIASPGIVLKVVPQTGGYNEQLTIPVIAGLGPIFGGESRLIIRGDGTANTKLWYSATTSTPNAYSVVYMNGADYITFDSLWIENTATSGYRYVMRLNTGSDNINVTNSTIKSNGNAYSGGYPFGIVGVKGTATFPSTWNGTDANNSKNCKFINNTIDGGYYGIYFIGSNSTTGTWPTGNEVSGNTFINPGTYATYFYRQNDVTFDRNDYKGAGSATTFNSAFYFNSVTNFSITNNRVDEAGYQAFYLTSCNYYNTVVGQSLIANNSVHGNSRTTSYLRAIYISRGQNFDVVYNSVYLGSSLNSTSSWSYTVGIYGSSWTGTSNKVLNNVVRFEDGGSFGYATYFTSSSISQFDYNTYYRESSGTLRQYWNGTTYTTLASFQTGSSTNANSQETDPAFLGTNDLHVNGAGLYGKGTPFAGVTKDYNDSTRSTTAPSPGIHEFIPPQNDAGVVIFTQPVAQCADTNEIEIMVKNFGILPLASFNIDWSWVGNGATTGNGSLSITATVPIPTGGDTTVFLSNILMTSGAPGYDFRAYTSQPNGVPDESNDNDTLDYSTQTALEGDFTIGGTSPDFATFTDAVNGLINFGVCGPVTFYARGGTYTERIVIGNLIGVDSINTVVFTVDTLNTVPVKIEYTSTSTADDGVWFLDESSFITIEEYDIENKGSSYAAGISINGNAHHITIMGNTIFNNAATSWRAYTIYINTSGKEGEEIHILDNDISGGYYGVYILGYNGSGAGMSGFRLEGNDITNASRMCVYITNVQNAVVSDNFIDATGSLASLFSYGMYFYGNGKGYEINNNVILANYYGLYCISMSGSSSDYSILSNNKVMIGDTALGKTIGFYSLIFNNSGFFNIAHNLFLSQTTRGYAAYFSGGLNHVYNNIFARVNSGQTVLISGSFAVTEMDYNAYHLTDGASQGLSYTQGLGYDDNGVEVNILYADLDSLFTCQDTLVGAGTPLSFVTTDIDGGSRSTTAPTIGPHEYISAGAFTLGDDQLLCTGDTLYLGADIFGASFLWNTGDTTGILMVTTAGMYDVTVTSGCTPSPGAKSSIEIENGTSVPAFTPDSSWMTITFMNNSINATTYMWDFGDGTSSTDMNPVHLYKAPGNYNVCLTATGECDANQTCKMVRAWNGVGIEGFDVNNAISIYPNPASDLITIKATDVPGNMMNIEITSIAGQVVMSSQLNDFNGYAKEDFDISELTKGVYFVKIFTNEVTTAKKLVIR